jgi:hypothetical protein
VEGEAPEPQGLHVPAHTRSVTVAACRHADRTAQVSTHTLVLMQLLPDGPGVLGPRLPRLRLSLQSDAYCRRRLGEWLEQQQAEVPTDQLAVVQQWRPTFKRQLRLKV